MDSCKLCKGTGWVSYKKDGKDFSRRCTCARNEIIDKMIPAIYQHPWQGDKTILKACITFLNSSDIVLVLWGPTGSGKTFAAFKLLEAWGYTNGFTRALFISAADLSNILHLITCGGSSRDEAEKDYYKIADSRLLIIDDYFSKPRERTDEQIAEFTSLWDLMLRRGTQKIIITTNWNPRALESQCDTIYSRLSQDSTWLEMSGKDRRLK